jgi:hypothetical protein
MKIFLIFISWNFLLSLAGAQACFSQDNPSVRAGTDRDTIFIGQPVRLMMEARLPLGSQVQWYAADSIPHFDFVEKGKLDSTTDGGVTVYRQFFSVTSFDSGTWYIPPLEVGVDNKKYHTDSIRIEVGYSKFDPGQPYHDIKEIVDVENPDVKYVVWVLLGLTLLAIALAIFLLRKKQVFDAAAPIPVVPQWPPFEEAMKALEELKAKNLPQGGQIKIYYTTLNDILRQFVLRKLHIASMEKTNEELIVQIRQLRLAPDHFSQLAEALRMSDSVKFAKFQPGASSNDMNFDIIESSVRLLNEIESSAV